MTHIWHTGLAGCLALASVVATAPAQAQTLNAKPGAWEMTVTMSGLKVPPETLAKMSPDQRAMVERQMAAGSSPQTRKSCVRKEDLEQDNFMKSSDPLCTVKTVSRSPNKLVMTTTCTSTPSSTGTMTFEARTPESVVGSMDQQRGDGSRFHIGITGKWLGASCDGIEPPPTKD